MAKLQVNLFKQQLEFLQDNDTPELLSYGGVGSGKTEALAWKLFFRASKPKAREGLCAQTLEAVKRNILKALLEGNGKNPPIMPPGSYEHNKAEKSIRIHGGGEILYFSLEDPGNVMGLNLTGCAIDELLYLSETQYNTVASRCRLEVPFLPIQVYSTTNPGSPWHWIAKRFGLAGNEKQGVNRAILTTPYDNHYLPKEYLKRIESQYTGVSAQRMIWGQWIGQEGLVWPEFGSHNISEKPFEPQRYFVACDQGYTHPFVALLFGVDSDNRLWVMDEVYSPGLQPETKASKVEAMRQSVGELETVVVDSQANELIAVFRDRGLPAIGAKKSVNEGLEKVRQRFCIAGDGKPRLYVHPKCKNLIRELYLYSYSNNGEEVRKENDDACDALRYGVMYLDSGKTFSVVFADYNSPASTVEAPKVTRIERASEVQRTEPKPQTDFEIFNNPRFWNSSDWRSL